MRYCIFISAIVLFFSSCANNSKSDLAVFRAITESLEQSNQTISESNADMSKSLYSRLTDPHTSEHAMIWQPKSEKISEASLSITKYITALKAELKNAATYKQDNTAYDYDDIKKVNKIFIQNNNGEDLYKKLNDFITVIYGVDESLNTQFANLKKETFYYLNSKLDEKQNFSKIFFNQISIAEALLILSKFENDVRNTENKLISYCYYQTFPISHGYEVFQTLVSINSSCVKAGDIIEINAGVGSFSVASQPKFTIDGKLISVNKNGIFVYKFKTPLKAGKYQKPIKMEYTKPDGTRELMTKSIEYTVIEPNQNP